MSPSSYHDLFLQSLQHRDWMLAFVVVLTIGFAINAAVIGNVFPKTQLYMWLLFGGGFYATLAMAYIIIR